MQAHTETEPTSARRGRRSARCADGGRRLARSGAPLCERGGRLVAAGSLAHVDVLDRSGKPGELVPAADERDIRERARSAGIADEHDARVRSRAANRLGGLDRVGERAGGVEDDDVDTFAANHVSGLAEAPRGAGCEAATFEQEARHADVPRVARADAHTDRAQARNRTARRRTWRGHEASDHTGTRAALSPDHRMGAPGLSPRASARPRGCKGGEEL